MNTETVDQIIQHPDITIEYLQSLTQEIDNLPKTYADTGDALRGELETITAALSTWERIAPRLYFMKKRLILCEEILNGKRDIESLTSLPVLGEKKERKKHSKEGKAKKAFIRRKSDILTDSVIGEIKKYISSDEDYHKAKDIYSYLVKNEIIEAFPGDTPDRAFAIGLARVDQHEISYNNHYTIMAWGLPDFGTAEHARRKTLKQSVRGDKGTKVSSYGPSDAVMAE